MLSKFSVKKPYTVLVGVVLAIVLGIVSFTKMTTDLLPSMSLPYVIVMTTYPGASPETVETVVTRPVESAMATVSNIQSVSSTSSENYSLVILEFAQSADMNAVSLEIRESLDQIESYWDDSVGSPIIMKLNPDMLPVMIAAVGVDGMTHAEISSYVEEKVTPELESIEGVASVSASGLLEESINVIIRQEKVDEVNKKIYEAIDKSLQEAADEIEEGKQKLEESKQELTDGKAEIINGQQELNNGKSELEDGKAELDKKQQETLAQLATTKTELLTAKTNLEASKLTITTNLTTAQALQDGINSIKPVLEIQGKYQTAYDKLQADMTSLESAQAELTTAQTELTTAQAQLAVAQAELDALIALRDALGGGMEDDGATEEGGASEEGDSSEEGGVAEGDGATGEGEATEGEGGSESTDATEEGATEAGGSEAEATIEVAAADPELDAQIAEKQAEVDALAAQVASINAQIAEINTQITTLNTNIQTSKTEIEALKKSYVENSIVQQTAQAEATLGGLVTTLKELDWTSAEGHEEVITNMTLIDLILNVQVLKLEDSLSTLTNGLGLNAYQSLMNQTMATINDGLNKVDQGLLEVEKGQTTAAIEFANAASQIALGEYQLGLTQSQLDEALSQIESGEEQLAEAEKQLEEGEKQLEEGRETAYEQADMSAILTVDMLKNLLVAQNFSMPAGYVTEEGVDYLVRIGDKPQTIEELVALPLMDLHMEDVPVITLGDVADIFIVDNSAESYTNVNGSVGCMLTIQKQTGYSTGEVSDLLLERFEGLMKEDDRLNIITLMDQGIFIDLVMDSIVGNILSGGALAILILLLFLKDLRPTFIVAVSIPISLVTAIVCMYFSGINLNVISLSGLALGIGMLVDNSIVVIENIYRLREEGMGIKEAAVEGAKEVAGAIFASTLTTVCVFLPIVFTEGLTRQLFVDMGLTIGYSLLASLLIALTVVPAMASNMLKKAKTAKDSKFFTAMINGYGRLLSASLKAKSLVIILAVALLVISVAAAVSRGTAFMPEMDSTQMTITVTLPEEATLQDTAELTNQVVERILEIEDVQDVGAMSGATDATSLLGGGGSENTATIYVVTYEDKTQSNEELAEIIRNKTVDLEAEIDISTSSMDLSMLGGSGITIQVRGRDIDTLQRLAGEVAAIVESVEGTTDVSDGLGDTNEELRIIVDRDKAISHGLTVAQVFTQIASKLADASVATTLEAANKDYSVYVANGKDTELTRELVQELMVTGTDKEGASVEVPLKDVAEFTTALSLESINRADQSRYISVSAAIAEGYNVGLVSADVEKKLENYQLPEGYNFVFSGENEMINDALKQVGLMLLLAVVFMYLIMVAQFQSLLSPFIIMFTIPLAFTGGFFALFFTGSEVSVIAMIGFVMLSGIIVNNGIVIVEFMNQLREQGMSKRKAIVTAGMTRLRPVLMTALTTILGLSTMVLSNDMGSEMARPMALVTIGGLLYGTLLTLFVIPCIYDIFIKEKKAN